MNEIESGEMWKTKTKKKKKKEEKFIELARGVLLLSFLSVMFTMSSFFSLASLVLFHSHSSLLLPLSCSSPPLLSRGCVTSLCLGTGTVSARFFRRVVSVYCFRPFLFSTSSPFGFRGESAFQFVVGRLNLT